MLTRPRIEALVREPDSMTVAAIGEALARGDGEEAAARAVARLSAGEAVAIEEIAEVLPAAPSIGVLLSLVGATGGDRVAALRRLLDGSRFPVIAPGLDLGVAAAFALWRLGGRAEQAAVARHLRRLMLHEMTPLANVLATSVVDDIKDPALTAATQSVLCQPEPEWTLAAARALSAPIAELIATFPAENEAARSVSGFTVRSAPRPGRNEPCHCGSGKKYKKCCADKDDAGTASPIVGMTWEQFLRDGAAQMTEEQVRALPLRDLAQLDVARLAAKPWAAAVQRFASFRRWDLAAAALDAAAEVSPRQRDDARALAITDALNARELDWVRGQIAKLADAEALVPAEQLRLGLLALPPETLAPLAAVAADVVKSEDRISEIELAFTLLDAVPGLGILVARQALGADRRTESEVLLEAIEDARDVLGFEPFDPVWEEWDAMKAAAGLSTPSKESVDAARLDKETRELKASLEVESQRVAELERELKRQRAAATAAGSRAQVPAESEAAAAERRALRDRLETLQAQIREQNEERAELRRKLAAGGTGDAPARRVASAAPVPEPEVDEPDTGASADPPRRALVPRFARAAEDAVADVPAHVAAAAIRTVGDLAAGDTGAWRGVKQAQDLEPPLWMARVGIHHRLLFRSDGGHLEILDLVTREALMHALKRLRR